MNEEALKDAYEYFYRTGYKGNIMQFQNLLNTNEDAVNDAYNYFRETGYNGSHDEFTTLLGVESGIKKKDTIGPSLEEKYKFKSILGEEFDQDVEAYEKYKKRKNKEAFEILKKARPDLEVPEKPEEAPEIKALKPKEPTTYYDIFGDTFRKEKRYFDITDVGLSKQDIEFRKKQQEIFEAYRKGEAELTPQQSVANSLANAMGQLATIDDRAKWLYGIAFKDLDAMGAAELELQRVESYASPTIQPENLVDDFSTSRLGAATFGALTSFGVSALQMGLTGGAGLATDMISQAIRDYNTTEAQEKGISLEELVEKGEHDILLPGTIGYLQYRLEKFGLKGVKNAINSLGNVAWRSLAKVFQALGGNAGEEYGQEVFSIINEEIATQEGQGKMDAQKLAEVTAQGMVSKRAFNAAANGALGGFGASFTGGTYKMVSSLKTPMQYKTDGEALSSLAYNEGIRNTVNLSETELSALEESDSQALAIIQDNYKSVDDLLKKAEQQEKERLEGLYDQQEKNDRDRRAIEASENLTEEQKNNVIQNLDKKAEGIQSEINKIRGVLEKREEVVEPKPEPKRKNQKFVDYKDEDSLQELKKKTDPVTDTRRYNLLNFVGKVNQALSRISPNLNIRLHETTESFNESINVKGKKAIAKGAFNPNENTIHIDLNNADTKTLAHEAFHAVLKSALKTDPSIRNAAKNLFETIKPQLPAKLREKLDDFSSNYEENFQNEERLSELFGLMVTNQASLDKTTVQKIKQWVNKTAKKLGLNDLFEGKDIERIELIDIMNSLSGKIKRGEVVLEEDIYEIAEQQQEIEVDSEQIIRQEKIGDFEKKYFETGNTYDQLKKQNLVRFENDLGFIPENSNVVVHMPDNMFVGDIYYKGKKVIKGEGGIFYVLNTGNVWSSSPAAVSRIVKMLNKQQKESKDGKARIVFVRGSQDKMISSTGGVKASMKILELMVDEGFISLKDFRSSLVRVGKKYNIDFSGTNSAMSIKEDIENKFMKPEASTFEKRGDFFSDLITDLKNTSKSVNENIEKIRSFLGAKQKISFSKQGIRSTIGTLLTERLLLGLPSGHVYAVVEVNQQVVQEKDPTHESYTDVVRQQNGDRPVLYLLNKRDNIDNLLNTKEGKTSQEEGKSFRGRIGLAQAGLGEAKTKGVRLQVLTPEEQESVKKSDQDFEKSKKALGELNKSQRKTAKQIFKETKSKLSRALLDRQYDAKISLLKSKTKEAKEAYVNMIVKSGANSSALSRFEEYDSQIYSELSKKDRDILDRIITERRLIAINQYRRENKLPLYYRGTDKLTDTDAIAKLKQLRESLGDDKFNSLSGKADLYFEAFRENLKRLYESGRIDAETYNRFKDIEYSPIKVIKYIIKDNEDIFSNEDIDMQAKRYGISKKDILALKDENEEQYITDSRWILQMHVQATERKRFQNKLLSTFAKALRSDSKLFEDQAYLDANQIPKGIRMTEVVYFENGKQKKMYLSSMLAKQLLDIDSTPSLTKFLDGFGKFTGRDILRFMATGGNPFFVVGNVALDFANISFFTDTYSTFKPLAMGELAMDAMVNTANKFLNTKNYKENYKDFLEHGGGMNYLSTDGINSLEEKKIISGLNNTFLKSMYKIGKVLSYLGESSEIAFRISVYNKEISNLTNQFVKNNGTNPTGEDLENIKYEAASKARSTIDFAQGGDYVKKADKVLPYLNAGMQGLRRPIDFAAKDPIKFTASVAQATLFAGYLPFVVNYIMSMLSDDDEERKELLTKFRGGLSKYEKSNYFTIPTKKNEDGTISYIRIRKLPILSVATTAAEELAYGIIEGGKPDYDAISQSALSSAPILPYEAVSRNPLISSLVAYNFNYDTFRKEEIFKGDAFNPIAPKLEGRHSDNVMSIFKMTGDVTGLSPIRTQVAFEKLFTSPQTNPLVALFYAGTEAGFSKNESIKEGVIDVLNDISEMGGRKVARKTNPKLQEYKRIRDFEKEIQNVSNKDYENDQIIKEKIRSYIKQENIKGIENRLPESIQKEIMERFEPFDRKRAAQKYSRYLNLRNTNPSIIDLAFDRNPERQAMRLFYLFEKMDSEEMNDVNNKVKAITGRSLPKKTIYFYKNILKDIE